MGLFDWCNFKERRRIYSKKRKRRINKIWEKKFVINELILLLNIGPHAQSIPSACTHVRTFPNGFPTPAAYAGFVVLSLSWTQMAHLRLPLPRRRFTPTPILLLLLLLLPQRLLWKLPYPLSFQLSILNWLPPLSLKNGFLLWHCYRHRLRHWVCHCFRSFRQSPIQIPMRLGTDPIQFPIFFSFDHELGSCFLFLLLLVLAGSNTIILFWNLLYFSCWFSRRQPSLRSLGWQWKIRGKFFLPSTTRLGLSFLGNRSWVISECMCSCMNAGGLDSDIVFFLFSSVVQLNWLNSHLTMIWPYVNEVNSLKLAPPMVINLWVWCGNENETSVEVGSFWIDKE